MSCPLRDVLPPQVMYYLSNPGQYFNITIQNPSTEAQQIFFGAELRQVTPASGLEVVVPAKTMPRQPIEVGAGATRVLTAAEMRTMFNHVRSSDVSMPSNLFSDVTSGSFGNLPEGTYEIIINAYQWNPNTPHACTDQQPCSQPYDVSCLLPGKSSRVAHARLHGRL